MWKQVITEMVQEEKKNDIQDIKSQVEIIDDKICYLETRLVQQNEDI